MRIQLTTPRPDACRGENSLTTIFASSLPHRERTPPGPQLMRVANPHLKASSG